MVYRRLTHRFRMSAWLVAVSVVVSCLVAPAPRAVAIVTSSGIQPLTPTEGLVTRVLDTRKTSALGARKILTVTLAGEQANAGIPATASGVLANLTVVHARRSGFLTLFPAGEARPLASSINFDTYQSAYANHLLIKLGAGGKVSIYNGSAAPVHVLLDVTGYIVGGANTAPGTTVATTPARVLDTATGNGAPNAPLRAGARLDVQISGRGGIPATGVAGVWIEVTGRLTTNARVPRRVARRQSPAAGVDDQLRRWCHSTRPER